MKFPWLTHLIGLVFLFMQISCATTRKTVIASPTNNAIETATLSFDPARDYELIIANQASPVRVHGNRLSVQNGKFLITDQSGVVRQIHDADKIGAIYLIEKTRSGRGKNALKGLLIGTIAGSAIGLAGGIGIGTIDECRGGCEETDLEGLAEALGVSFGIVSTLLGAGLGAGIGALLPVKK